MMKAKDCAVATALVLNGYLHANQDDTVSSFDTDRHLLDALRAIRGEVGDWAENLDVPNGQDHSALEPEALSVDALSPWGASIARTPYNLVSVAIAALREAVDLNGPEAVLADFQHRGGVPTTAAPTKPAGKDHPLIEAADELAAEIDAANDRPVSKLALWHATIETLRARGVDVESACTAPANWS